MSEAVDYFKKERYITRRLSLVVLAATAVLLPVTLAASNGRIPPVSLPLAIAGVVVAVVFMVLLILRAANNRFPRSTTPDHLPMDKITRRKLRRRVLILEILAAVYAFVLISTVAHAHLGQWPGVLCTAAVVLLMDFALIKAILRLRSKLKEDSALDAGHAVE
jgi:archaellum biogenesis protein FlaJ (TadC family)